MPSLRDILRKITPEEILLMYRVRKAQRLADEYSSLRSPVPQRLLQGARVLADRHELLARLPKEAAVAEIGVAEGSFSAQILEIAQPRKLYLIDPWDFDGDARYSEKAYHGLMKTMKKEIESGKIELLRGYSFDKLLKLPENSLDWVYVDAAHDYKNVRRDLDACFRVVRSGGMICGHDYVRWTSPISRYGVVEAVNEFANRINAKFLYLTNEAGGFDSYCLEINKETEV